MDRGPARVMAHLMSAIPIKAVAKRTSQDFCVGPGTDKTPASILERRFRARLERESHEQ
jgi:hypothetical protein